MTSDDEETWTGFHERWRFPEEGERALRPVPDVAVPTLRETLGLEVVGAHGESPTLMYVNPDGSTGLIRPALEPEVRMWKLLLEVWG